MGLQKFPGVGGGGGGDVEDLRFDAVFPGGGAQQGGGAPGPGEDLAAVGKGIAGEAYRHVTAAPQLPDHLPLLGGEVREAVQIYRGAFKHGAAGDLPGQYLQPGDGIGPGPLLQGVHGLPQQRQIHQLSPQRTALDPGGVPQGLGIGPAGPQLVQGREELGHLLRGADGAAVYAQRAPRLLQGQGQLQQPPACVHVCTGAAARVLGSPVGQTGKGEHLGVKTHLVPAAHGQLPLGLMAVLLRHHQQSASPALPYPLRQLPIDQTGLAGPGPAEYQPKHDAPPFRESRFLYYTNLRPRWQGGEIRGIS